MKKGMTIKQIAEAAGVSIGTVSRIIKISDIPRKLISGYRKS